MTFELRGPESSAIDAKTEKKDRSRVVLDMVESGQIQCRLWRTQGYNDTVMSDWAANVINTTIV